MQRQVGILPNDSQVAVCEALDLLLLNYYLLLIQLFHINTKIEDFILFYFIFWTMDILHQTPSLVP